MRVVGAGRDQSRNRIGRPVQLGGQDQPVSRSVDDGHRVFTGGVQQGAVRAEREAKVVVLTGPHWNRFDYTVVGRIDHDNLPAAREGDVDIVVIGRLRAGNDRTWHIT